MPESLLKQYFLPIAKHPKTKQTASFLKNVKDSEKIPLRNSVKKPKTSRISTACNNVKKLKKSNFQKAKRKPTLSWISRKPRILINPRTAWAFRSCPSFFISEMIEKSGASISKDIWKPLEIEAPRMGTCRPTQNWFAPNWRPYGIMAYHDMMTCHDAITWHDDIPCWHDDGSRSKPTGIEMMNKTLHPVNKIVYEYVYMGGPPTGATFSKSCRKNAHRRSRNSRTKMTTPTSVPASFFAFWAWQVCSRVKSILAFKGKCAGRFRVV